jgi:hypothetical protein
MAKPYSEDLRRCVVEAIDGGANRLASSERIVASFWGPFRRRGD